MATQSQLVMRTGPNPGKTFSLNKPEMYIGRDINNEIVINDAEVSRKHVRFILQGNDYVIEDLGSTNGTFINGQRIAGPHLLSSGETIQMGENVSLVFETSTFDPDSTAVMSPRDAASMDMPPAPVPEPEPEPMMAPLIDPEPEPEPMMAPLIDPEPEPAPMPEPMPEPVYTPPPAPAQTMAEPAMPQPAATFTGQATPAMAPPPPMQSEAPPKKGPNRGLLIGCGCLLLIVICGGGGWALYTYGDALLKMFGF